MNRVCSHAYNVGAKLVEDLLQTIFNSEVEYLDIVVVPDSGGDVLQGKGFVQEYVLSADRNRWFGRLEQ
jgi:hypothetical protein